MAGSSYDSAHGAPSGAGLSLDWAAITEWALALISAGFVITGAFFVLAGALGVLRMPDFFTRIHAAGMTDTLGAEAILIGLMIQAGFSQMTLKLILVAFFLFLTSPTATHAIANAAHKSGVKPLLGRYAVPKLDEIGRESAPNSNLGEDA